MLLLRERLEKARETIVIPFVELQALFLGWTILSLLAIDPTLDLWGACTKLCRNLLILGLLSGLLLRTDVRIYLVKSEAFLRYDWRDGFL